MAKDGINSIRVKSESEYKIEVNDNGECIVFDMRDLGMTSRIMKMYEEIDALNKRLEAEAAEIDARPDTEENEAFSKNQADGLLLIERFYAESRKVMDTFLGENACQKIFGDKNYVDMFDDLIEQLKPHFEKMGLNAKAIRERTSAKYAPNREARRAMK